MSALRFDAQTVFLTFPHCSLEHNAVKEAIDAVCKTVWARVCTESHEDGDKHIHAVAKFHKRFQCRDCTRTFDINGHHPNIQPVRSINHVLEYIAKDGEYTDYGTVPSKGDDFDWKAAAVTMDNGDYFGEALKKRIPYQYAKHFWDLAQTKDYTISSGKEHPLERECPELWLHGYCENKATVVVGPTGCGKTSWAKRIAPKPALWVRHLDVLRSFRSGMHKSIIFDDMSFAHLPRETQIILTDWNDSAHIHCRYGHALIPEETVKIFTANQLPFLEDPAILRRIHLINL